MENRSSVPSFGVFDRDNPILSFDLEPDLPQILMQQVAVFDRDNPRRSDNDKGPFTRTGNFINVDPVPLTSELEPDHFDSAPLTSDLEPDRSGYFPLYL